MKAAPNFEPMLLWCRPHPSMQATVQWRRSHSARTSNLPPDHDKEQTLPRASLEAQWPAEQAALMPFARAQECISMAPRPRQPRLCTQHNNSDQSELIGERISYSLQVRTQTIIY